MVNLESLKSVRAQKAPPQVITSFQSSGGIGLKLTSIVVCGLIQFWKFLFKKLNNMMVNSHFFKGGLKMPPATKRVVVVSSNGIIQNLFYLGKHQTNGLKPTRSHVTSGSAIIPHLNSSLNSIHHYKLGGTLGITARCCSRSFSNLW